MPEYRQLYDERRQRLLITKWLIVIMAVSVLAMVTMLAFRPSPIPGVILLSLYAVALSSYFILLSKLSGPDRVFIFYLGLLILGALSLALVYGGVAAL